MGHAPGLDIEQEHRRRFRQLSLDHRSASGTVFS
jgi:hypothetical protein